MARPLPFRRVVLKSGVLSEEVEQFNVVRHLRSKYPGALFTIAPNGNKLRPRAAEKFKLMGYRAGTPDIMIFEPRGGHKALFLEMKVRKGGKVSEEQKAFLLELRARGFFAMVCAGAGVAIAVIDAYMAGDKEAPKEPTK